MIHFFDWLVTDGGGFGVFLVVVGLFVIVKLMDASEYIMRLLDRYK